MEVSRLASAPGVADGVYFASPKCIDLTFQRKSSEEAMPKLMQCIAGLVIAIVISVPSPAAAQKDAASVLIAKVLQLSQAGKYSEAIPLAQRALAIREKALGPDHPDVAASLNTLANLYVKQGRYADAEPLTKRALAIREKAFGPDHPNVATPPAAAQNDDPAALSAKAAQLSQQGKYLEAIPLAQQALALYQKTRGPNHPYVAIALSNLAALYGNLGRYPDAEPLYQQALAIEEKALGPDHPDVATELNNLATLYQVQGRYADGEPLYKRSLAIREKVLGPDHPDVAVSLNSLAELYRNQGRYADAEPLTKRALAIREKALGPDHPDVAVSLNTLANLYVNQGRYADAEPLYQRSLAIRAKAFGPDHPNVAQSLNNLALLYRNQGRYAAAEPLYQRALAIWEKTLGPDHPDVATDLNNLATLYQVQGRYADAEPLYKRSLAIREKTLSSDHPDVAQSLYNLALLYQSQGHYADAEPLTKRALAIRERALGPDHPDVAVSLNSLAELYRGQGHYADALPLARRVIANGRALPGIALPILLGAELTKLISAEKAIDDSLNVLQRAAQTSAASAISKLAVRLAAGSDRLAQLVRQDQDLAAESETLDKAILAAVSNEPSKRDAANEQRIRERLAAIAEQRDGLQKTFAKDFPDYATLSNPLPLTTKDVQGLLSADEVLMLLSSGDKEAYVFALTRDGFDWKAIPFGADALGKKVATFRRGLDVDQLNRSIDVSGKPELFDLGLANELYATLLGPVETMLKDKKQLLVVPSGALTSLPFHLLVTQKPSAALPENLSGYRDAAWLIKRQGVTVLPSVASLKALRQFGRKDQGAKPMVGFGDPVFNPNVASTSAANSATKTAARSLITRSYTDFWQGAGVDRDKLAQALPQLPDTAVELRAVAQKLGVPTSDIHLGKDASETTVKRTPLADYRIVYFATHGLVAGDVKGVAEPSLVFSIPPQPSDLDDGLLTASEVAQLKLNADWVVLSACNTIAGDKPGAEALSGLARAFFYAGARALLVSHWAVDSNAATRLTTSTFDLLKADPSLGRAEALRRAELAYLNDLSDPKNAYPAFWAPFEIVGEGAASSPLTRAPAR
jgi:CHAT domain-containing protein/Tfp pilus assembly protein PilF